ncbi:MAG: DUF296 domain-containing protein [Mesorhizobium sp.]|uniref:PCC domain-containing protein n=1 Tax=unclassified Mesorhizobium TaxID=325217 RepID=UPI000FE47734|nr:MULTISPECIES: DUF296 domain-containing protein [unclassified Mesorhizobium]RWI29967.1 MAG: DUF296 domain-containing protein [Mesorhizobium sp.]RWK50481.1 MAG: DUF296 domain-containing protein [Mesorhizobium sp.]RWK98338.1 MAG: DUF296 domain-containing protein [Mesorhizobium sp.]TIP59815.1 MAG: aminopeptidase P family protein [Mesorhizobium sp.]TJW38630.1 MAG: aminopeptidase P family protein [Mesorhizobium sp.]
MRSIRHPGPIASERFAAMPCAAAPLTLRLETGSSVNDAVAQALADAGFGGGYIRLRNARLDPMRYVIPAASPDGTHAAWYSDTFAPEGMTVIEDAGLVAGRRDEQPFLHCHGIWRTPDGVRRMGHLLPLDSHLAEPVEVTAWGIEGALFDVRDDTETNFRLFAPIKAPVLEHFAAKRLRLASDKMRQSKELERGFGSPKTQSAPGERRGRRAAICTVKPNEDIGQAIEAVCRRHGFDHASIQGIGSLVGADFDDGSAVSSYATEVLVTDGAVRSGRCTLDIALVGMDGVISAGRLRRDANPVCVTFELLVVASDEEPA